MSNVHQGAGQREWRNSEFICAFADAERHLGHLVKMEQWHAYDATHSDDPSGGIHYLGEFADVAAAKQVVELAVAGAGRPKTMGAGSRW
jgi:hypothetical protein